MARPRKAGSPATVMEVAAAMANDDIKAIKDKKISRSAIEKAAALAKGFNQRFKMPDAFQKMLDSLPVSGGGGVGRAPPAVNETRKYKLTKDRALVISLKAYEWAQAGGLAEVHFSASGPVVSKAK